MSAAAFGVILAAALTADRCCEQGTINRVVVVNGHTLEVAKMLKKIGELDEGGTVSDTLYVTTTDSLPSPSDGWPSIHSPACERLTASSAWG